MIGLFYIIPIVLFILSVFVAIGIVVLRLLLTTASGGQGDRTVPLPYKKKLYLLSVSERKCYETLVEVLPEKFVIFPQLNLDKLIYSEDRHYEHLNKIDRKSVDFVICSREYLSPVLVIELDDPTHMREARIARDNFVNSALHHAGLNLLRLHNSDLLDKTKLKNLIETNLGISDPPAKS